MKRETLETLSQKIGISKTTISRVLNGKAEKYRISTQTIKFVNEQVKKYDYTPNTIAQILRNKYSKTIALIVPDITNPFFANIAGVIINKAHENGYIINVMDTFENKDEEIKAIINAQSHNIDGIILVPSGTSADEIEEINKEKTPIVLIDRYFDKTTLPYVSTDNYEGGYKATKLLLEAGHRKILCIQGELDSITTKERSNGYHKAMQEFENESNCRICGKDFSIQNGYIETKIGLTSPNPPTAIFAMSSTILLGALKAINEQGLNVPQDISIISFDSNLFMDYLNPPVTRIKQPVEEIGIIAFKIIQNEIEEELSENKQILLSPELIIRESIKIIS